jgi:hypothetical protein
MGWRAEPAQPILDRQNTNTHYPNSDFGARCTADANGPLLGPVCRFPLDFQRRQDYMANDHRLIHPALMIFSQR